MSTALSDKRFELLEHSGVKGMKWGVRRGKKIRGARTKGEPASSKAKKLSDDDLRKAIQRMELEKKYVDLSKSTSTKTGAKHAKNLLAKSGNTLFNVAAGAVATKAVKRVIKP